MIKDEFIYATALEECVNGVQWILESNFQTKLIPAFKASLE